MSEPYRWDSTIERERADEMESTHVDERAEIAESSIPEERAVLDESTELSERAIADESTTSDELHFIVWGHPEPRGSKTPGISKKGRRFVRDSNPQSYKWMDDVARAAGPLMMGRELLTGPLRVDLDFYQARPKGHYGSGRNADVVKASSPARPIVAPDKGKLERGVLDALEGIVYRNDAQVVEGDSRKFYGTPERCEVRVTVVG